MKDYTTKTNLKSIDNIVNYALEKKCLVVEEMGVLNDFYIIKNSANIRLNDIKPREYIICYYKYKNSCANDLYITVTDSIECVKRYAEKYGCEMSVVENIL